MKIRSGFVSNSSSSSFCIFGAMFTKEQLIDALSGEQCTCGPKDESDIWPPEGIASCKRCEFEDDIYSFIDDALKGTKLESLVDWEVGEVYIGRSMSTIKDSETGKEFKDKVRASFKKLFGKTIKCSVLEGEVYS